MSRLPRLLRTSAVRLALGYVLVFAAVLGIAMLALGWSMRWYVGSGLERELDSEFRELSADPAKLDETIVARLPDAIKQHRYYLLVAPDDTKLAGNMRIWPPEPDIALDARVHGSWIDEDAFPAGLYEDEPYMPIVATRLADGRRLLLARGGRDTGILREATEFLGQVLGVAVVLALLLGIVMGRAILRRMDTVGATATAILHGDLSRRVPVTSRDDEFDALAARLNTMLDRIQQLVRGLREVTDNVAHDLRRPLARLRNRMEITLLEPRSPEEYRQALALGLQDADSLIRTFNALLEIAQAEAGQVRNDWGIVDLAGLAQDLAELYAPPAEEKSLRFELDLQDAALVAGSRNLLGQAIGNLLENAIKYTPEGGCVRLGIQAGNGTVELIVSDTGPGIPAPEREHVLERFVRLDDSRNTEGNGLGLSLVRAAAAAHRAQLLLEDAAPGLRVRLRFARATGLSG